MAMQDIIMAAFLREDTFYAEFAGLLDSDMFSDSTHKILANVYIDYTSTYNHLPSEQEMYAELDTYCNKYGIDSAIKQLAIEALQQCYKITYNVDFARDNFVKFATNNKLTKAIIDAAKDIKSKGDQLDDTDYEKIHKRIEEAIDIKSRDSEGILLGDVADDPKAYITTQNRFDKSTIVPTGLPSLDGAHIAGGMLPGELGVIAAPPGRGKSTLLVNFGAYAAATGKDVVHVFIGDNTEADGVLRYCARMTGVPMAQVMLDSQTYLDSWAFLKQNFHLGNVMIKAYPIDGCTVADIRSFITKNMIRKGIKPKLLIVDYADNCKRNLNVNSYEQMGEIYRGLKNICEELKLVGWTASQPKVDTWESDTIGLGGLSESSMKQHIIDAMLTMTRKDDQNFDIFVPKYRRGRSEFHIPVLLNYDRMTVKESFVNRVASTQAGAAVTPPVSPTTAPTGAPVVPPVPTSVAFGSTYSTPVGP